jgi:hypothetical protein
MTTLTYKAQVVFNAPYQGVVHTGWKGIYSEGGVNITTPVMDTLTDVEHVLAQEYSLKKKTALVSALTPVVSGTLVLKTDNEDVEFEYSMKGSSHSVNWSGNDGKPFCKGGWFHALLKNALVARGVVTDSFSLASQDLTVTSTLVAGCGAGTNGGVTPTQTNGDKKDETDSDNEGDVNVGGIFGPEDDDW